MMRRDNGIVPGEDVDYREGTKLLDLDSTDSDTQEHFSLESLKAGRSSPKK